MFGFISIIQEQPVPVPDGDSVFAFFQELFVFVSANGVTSFISLLVIAAYAFTLIATITPNESDNKVADLIWKVINGIGLNVGKAKNK